jgi:hypothetical protein
VDNTNKIFGDVMSRDRFQQIFWMMHVGNDTTEESSRAVKRTKKVHGVIINGFRNILLVHFMPFLHQIFEQNSSLTGFAGI